MNFCVNVHISNFSQFVGGYEILDTYASSFQFFRTFKSYKNNREKTQLKKKFSNYIYALYQH